MPGFFSPAWLDELRQRLDIVDVVGSYLPLKRSGSNYMALCPFHNEKTPSFNVSGAKQIYHCFGCQKGGDVISFIIEIERVNFVEAATMLAERAGMKLPEGGGPKPEDVELKARILEANTEAARFYHQTIWSEAGRYILDYVHGRGVDDAAIRRFGLGATPSSKDGLTVHMLGKGYAPDELVAAGLAYKNETGIRDMMRSRLIFPIVDARGNVVGFGGRATGEATPKYLNSPDTPAFNKRFMLYNINRVKKEKQLTHIILVEGYMDVVSLSCGGVQNVCATLGTAMTQDQARLVSRFSKSLLLAYDGDGAGQKAILRALPIAEGQGLGVQVLDLPKGKDPDDVIREGKAAWEAAPRLTAVEYRLRRAMDGLDLATHDGRTEYAILASEILARIESPIELENHLRRLTVDTGFTKDVLLAQINKNSQKQNSAINNRYNNNSPALMFDDEDASAQITPAKDGSQAERQLLALLATNRLKPGTVKPGDFQNELYRQIAERLLSGELLSNILSEVEDGKQHRKLTRAFLQDPGCDDERLYALAEDCLNVLALRRINGEIIELKSKVDKLTGTERTEAIMKIGALLSESNRLKSGKKE